MLRRHALLGVLALSSIAFAAGCGGGDSSASSAHSTSSGGTGTGGTGGGGGGTGTGSGSGATTAGAAEGEWAGLVPIFGGIDAVGIGGIVSADGSAYFVVAGEVQSGSLLTDSRGTVETRLVHYGQIDGQLGASAIGPLSGSQNPNFDYAVARTSLSGQYKGSFVSRESIRLGYDVAYDLPAAMSRLAGVYTINESGAYVFTLSINADGQISGSDTKGCALVGSATVPDPVHNVYEAQVDVSSCGDLDGHYAGILSLRGGTANNDELFLALRSVRPVADQNVIFHDLYR